MSKMIHIEVNNHNYLFSCSSRNTRSGFAHDCTLFRDYNEIASATCHYLNRTWERWTYETACSNAVQNEINWRIDHLKDDYKYSKNVKRMTKKHQEQFEMLVNANEYIKELQQVKDELKKKVY